MECQDATTGGAEMAGQHTGSHRMLRAGTKATEQASGKELLKVRGETAGHDRKPKHAVSDTENHSSPDVRNDETVKSLEDAAQSIVDGRKRSDRHVTQAQFFHHERVDNAQHRRLKMVNKMRAADYTENRRALAIAFLGSYGLSVGSHQKLSVSLIMKKYVSRIVKKLGAALDFIVISPSYHRLRLIVTPAFAVNGSPGVKLEPNTPSGGSFCSRDVKACSALRHFVLARFWNTTKNS